MDATLYENDFYAWATRNAKLMREGKLSEIDVDHIAEELEEMSGSQRRELVSRLAVLTAHLLKWQYEPELRGRSWKLTIMSQRDNLADLLDESPSLKSQSGPLLPKAYGRAKRYASIQTGLSETAFPDLCPYSFDQLIDPDYWPK